MRSRVGSGRFETLRPPPPPGFAPRELRIFVPDDGESVRPALFLLDGQDVFSDPRAPLGGWGVDDAVRGLEGGADEIQYDAASQRVYFTGTTGHVDVFKQVDADHYQSLGKLITAADAKTSLLVPELKRFYVAVPKRNVLPKPADLSFEDAACLPTAWLTAYRMLFTRGQITPGMTVLVQGAAGGVATALTVLGAAAGVRVSGGEPSPCEEGDSGEAPEDPAADVAEPAKVMPRMAAVVEVGRE